MNQRIEYCSDQFPILPLLQFEVAELGARLAALEGEVFLLKRDMERLQQRCAQTEKRQRPLPAKG